MVNRRQQRRIEPQHTGRHKNRKQMSERTERETPSQNKYQKQALIPVRNVGVVDIGGGRGERDYMGEGYIVRCQCRTGINDG